MMTYDVCKSKSGKLMGRQQNPEHGTFRNIPEQGKLSQNK